MRYREDAVGAVIQPSNTETLITATVLFTLLIGVGFVVAGYRGRQIWLTVWGGMTVLMGSAYFVAMLFGYA
jgi:hypothetical protein